MQCLARPGKTDASGAKDEWKLKPDKPSENTSKDIAKLSDDPRDRVVPSNLMMLAVATILVERLVHWLPFHLFIASSSVFQVSLQCRLRNTER